MIQSVRKQYQLVTGSHDRMMCWDDEGNVANITDLQRLANLRHKNGCGNSRTHFIWPYNLVLGLGLQRSFGLRLSFSEELLESFVVLVRALCQNAIGVLNALQGHFGVV